MGTDTLRLSSPEGDVDSCECALSTCDSPPKLFAPFKRPLFTLTSVLGISGLKDIKKMKLLMSRPKKKKWWYWTLLRLRGLRAKH